MTIETYDDLEIYRKLASLHEIDSMGSNPMECGERVFIPLHSGDRTFGAMVLLSVLCYPEHDEKSFYNRVSFLDHVMARLVKRSAPEKSLKRKKLRFNKSLSSLIDVPEKRITQNLSMMNRKLDKRLRTAWVFWKKVSSSPEFWSQDSSASLYLQAAKFETTNHNAFKVNDNESTTERFRQRVIEPTKPVLHLAMSIYSILLTKFDGELVNLFTFLEAAETWLPEALYQTESYRLDTKLMFPTGGKKADGGRYHNNDIQRSQSIQFLPWLEPLESLNSKDEILTTLFPNFKKD
jgi:hypothetical protein